MKKIFEEDLRLDTEDVYHIMAMADSIAGMNKKDAYGYSDERIISYFFFCMELEKTILLKKTMFVPKTL